MRIILFLLFLIYSCISQQSAMIDFHDYYDNESQTLRNPYYIRILPGDTLYKVSKRAQVGIKDLIIENHIKNPYKIADMHWLRVPEPRFHIVKKNDNLYSISLSYSVNMSKIISKNHLKPPFALKEGMLIKLPSKIELRHVEYINKKDKVGDVVLDRFGNDNNINSLPERKSLLLFPLPERKRAFVSLENLKNNMRSHNRSDNISNHLSHFVSFIWPVKGRVILDFGIRKGGIYNDGINIASKSGKAFVASEKGEVVYSGNGLRGYGKLLLIKHQQDYITAYAHGQKIIVRKGDYVDKGQVIGYVGSTGNVTSSQLHFSIRRGRTVLNPLDYLIK